MSDDLSRFYKRADVEKLIDEQNKAFEMERANVERAEAERDHYRAALQSIANSTCCTGCQEAALVARAALKGGTDVANLDARLGS